MADGAPSSLSSDPGTAGQREPALGSADAMSTGLARRLVRQQAVTGVLLGVDMLPVGRAVAGKGLVQASGGGRVARENAATAREADVGGPSEVRVSHRARGLGSSGGEGAGLQWVNDPLRRARHEALEAIRARYIADAPHEAFGYAFTNIVFGEGDPAARLMLIGEAPGAEEDRTGRPFVGRAGQLLEKMLVAMGLSREGVYIANVLKVRPPNNATPTTEEREACKAYLFEQVAAVRPEVIVTLGLPASQTILATDLPMGKMRGNWSNFSYRPSMSALEAISVAVMPTYHPAYLLRSYTPENRKAVWSDLQRVMERLGLTAPSGQ